MFKGQIRCATDEQLRAIVTFFDVPELRRYYAGLLDDVRCELELRAEKGDRDALPSET